MAEAGAPSAADNEAPPYGCASGDDDGDTRRLDAIAVARLANVAESEIAPFSVFSFQFSGFLARFHSDALTAASTPSAPP